MEYINRLFFIDRNLIVFHFLPHSSWHNFDLCFDQLTIRSNGVIKE